jgi:hypothetical protein
MKGSVIEELAWGNIGGGKCRIFYKLISGVGPQQGWLSTDLLEKVPPYGTTNKTFAKQCGTELYHQTNEAIAKIILRTQTFKPGSKGLAGPGIYFATSEKQTGHKARAHGVILRAFVRMGKILTLDADGDTRMSLHKLRRQGYDSVCIARTVSSGHEYVVYDPAQVLYVERA